MDGESTSQQNPQPPMQEEDEHIDVTAMVSRIDSLEHMMHVMVDQMQEFTAVRHMDKGK